MDFFFKKSMAYLILPVDNHLKAIIYDFFLNVKAWGKTANESEGIRDVFH